MTPRYNAAGGAGKPEEKDDEDDRKRAPGSVLSHSSRRAERPNKAARMDADAVAAANKL